jgi:hypothetical protein
MEDGTEITAPKVISTASYHVTHQKLLSDLQKTNIPTEIKQKISTNFD